MKKSYFWLCIPAFLFGLLSVKIILGWQWAWDVRLLDWLQVHTGFIPDGLVIAVTNSGGGLTFMSITALIAVVVAWRCDARRAVLVLLSVFGAVVLNALLKLLFRRERPDLLYSAVESGFSFPSGHAMASAALAISLIWLAWPSRWRWWVLAAGSVFTVTMGLTRMLLGVHYPTDILGGWCAALLWVAVVNLLADRAVGHRQSDRNHV